MRLGRAERRSARLAGAAFLLVLALCPAARALELRNVQACYGPYGPVRAKLDMSPLDEVMFRFTVGGLKAGPDGKSNAEVEILLTNASVEVFKEHKPLKAEFPFGGDSVATNVAVVVGQTAAPGDYLLRIRVNDKLAGTSAQFFRKLVCKPAAFRAINPRFYYDAAKTLNGPGGGWAGQTTHLRVQAAQPAWQDGGSIVAMRLEVTDLEGTIVSRRPIIVRREAKEGGPFRALALDASLPLGRAGDYILKLTLVDEVAKTEAVLLVPLTVLQP